jgi:translation initiation factor 1
MHKPYISIYHIYQCQAINMKKRSVSDDNSRLVYSTDSTVQRKEARVIKDAAPALPTAQQKVIVRLDCKARRGKSVTVIEGIQLPQKEIKSLLKQLKGKLGTGGAIKESSIEIQGEHCDKIIPVLEKMGYRPKRSGK